jgi:hypothetical protein
MSISKGIKNLRDQVDKASGQGDNRRKVDYVGLKDGQSVKGRFLQELDPDSPNYDSERGLGFIASEVVDPLNFKRKCLDTLEDEGQSFGWEMHNKLKGTDGYDGQWKPKKRLYINFLQINDDGTSEVKVLSQGISGKSITPTLLEYAGDTGSITDKVFRIKRTGSELSTTSYALMLIGEDKEPFNYEGLELYDLEETVVRKVPYAEQPEFFGIVESETDLSTTSESIDW